MPGKTWPNSCYKSCHWGEQRPLARAAAPLAKALSGGAEPKLPSKEDYGLDVAFPSRMHWLIADSYSRTCLLSALPAEQRKELMEEEKVQEAFKTLDPAFKTMVLLWAGPIDLVNVL